MIQFADEKTIERVPPELREQVRRVVALSEAVARAGMAARLGKSYGDDRDVYEALGYPRRIRFDDYLARYRRQDIAKAVVNVPVYESWRLKPELVESEDDETDFERAWADLVRDLNVFHHLARVDRISGVGEYGALYLGLADGAKPEAEAKRVKSLAYLACYDGGEANVSTWDEDEKSARYGRPTLYDLSVRTSSGKGRTIRAHWTRVIHVAEDSNDGVYGTPRLEAVYNRMQDLELVCGGSAEMFWRGGLPGIAFEKDADAVIEGQTLDALKDEIEEYLHGLKRYLRLQGIKANVLLPNVADPTGVMASLIDPVSAATRIPKRILLGSERGELASTTDESTWLNYVKARQRDHCEPVILRPFVDRLISFGVLPKPANGYQVIWPDLLLPSANEKADVAVKRTTALAAYAGAPGTEDLVPPEVFLRDVIGFDETTIQKIEAINDEIAEALGREAESEPEAEPDEPGDEPEEAIAT